MTYLLKCLPIMLAVLTTSWSHSVAAQMIAPVTVRSVVRDGVSGSPIPFAVVEADGRSSLTNRDGSFRIDVRPGITTLEVRKIGYRMLAVEIEALQDLELDDLLMSPIPVGLDAISVTAQGDDLATQIIRRAIARKQEVLGRINNYRYDAYVKMLVRNAARHEDSVASIVLVTESQTSAYWEHPDRFQETIVARRQSRNLDAENNLVSVGQIVNFNRDRIDLQVYSVVSPTADDALNHYTYHVLDTLTFDGRRVFRLAIEPRSTVEPLFVGMIDILDSTYDVRSIDVGANEAVRFDFFDNLRYRQQLRDFGGDRWMPERIEFAGEVKLGIPLPGFPQHMTFAHSVSLQNFVFDEGNRPPGFGEYMIVVDRGADRSDSARWHQGPLDTLSALEQAAYARIDSIERIPPPFGRQVLGGVAATLLITGNRNFFRFNRVEGAYLGLGGTWTGRPEMSVTGRAGYGFGREEWQASLGGQYRLVESQRLWLGGTWQSEVVPRPTFVSPGRNSTYSALLSRRDPLDYYHQRGVSIFASVSPVKFTQMRLQFNDLRQRSAGIASDYSLFVKDDPLRANPPIADGRLRSLSGAFTIDSRPLLKNKGRDFYMNMFTYTRVTFGVEWSEPEFIPSDFSFRRYTVQVFRRQRTLNLGLTSMTALAGVSEGVLPPQRYFTVDHGNGFFFQDNGFNTLEQQNFSGNRAVMLYGQHSFDRQLFRRTGLPLIRDIPLDLSVHGGAFWTDFVGDLAGQNDPLARSATTAYTELGFGVGNLTPFLSPFNFSVWFTWQLSSYDTDKFAFSVGVPGT